MTSVSPLIDICIHCASYLDISRTRWLSLSDMLVVRSIQSLRAHGHQVGPCVCKVSGICIGARKRNPAAGSAKKLSTGVCSNRSNHGNEMSRIVTLQYTTLGLICTVSCPGHLIILVDSPVSESLKTSHSRSGPGARARGQVVPWFNCP